MAGQAVFQSGTSLQLVAQTWLVLGLSDSGTALGWLATALRHAALAFATAMAVAALASSLVSGVVAAALCGATGWWFVCGATSLLQLRVVESMRGRVMALSAVVMLGAGPIGGPVMGWISESVGP